MAENSESKRGAGGASLRRQAAWVALALLGLLLLVLVASALLRGAIAERLVRAELAKLGIEAAELRVARFDLEGLTLADLRLGRDRALEADRVEVTYDLESLRARQVASVRVDGLRFKVRIDQDGASLGSLDPLLAGGKEGAAAPLPALPPIRFENAELTFATPLGAYRVEGDGDLRSDAAGALGLEAELRSKLESGPLAGHLSVLYGAAGRLEGRLALEPADHAQGGLRLAGLSGAFDFSRGGPDAAPQLRAQLAIAAARLGETGLGAVTAGLDFDGARAHLDGTLAGEEALAAAKIAASVDLFAAPMTVEAEARIEAPATAGLWRLLALPPPRSARADLSLKLAGTPAALDGGLTLDATAAGLAAGAVTAEAADLSLHADLSVRPDRITLAPPSAGRLRLEGVAAYDRLALDGPLELGLELGQGPLAEIDFGQGGMRYRNDLVLAPAAFAAALAPDGAGSKAKPLHLTGTTPRLAIAGAEDGGGYAGRLEAQDGSLVLTEPELGFTGIGGSAELGARGADRPELARLHVAAISHLARPRAVVPLSLDGVIEGVAGGLHFSARLADASGRLVLDLSGDHDLEAGGGEGRVKLARLDFGAGGAAPAALFPVLGGLVEEAGGGLALDGRFDWGAAGAGTRLELLLDNLSFSIGGIDVRGVNSVLSFDSRRWRERSARQEIAVAAVDMGVPLRDGVVALRFDNRGRLLVEEMRWQLAGGRLDSRDIVLDPTAPRRAFDLDVSGVDVGALAELFRLEGLSATGTLDGRIPLTIVGTDVVIANGELHAREPGRLSYSPAIYPAGLGAQGQGVGLMLQALTNFQYEELRLKLDREIGGEAVIGVHLKGRNPDFYDGYPVDFNLNLSGRLDEIVRQGLEGYQVPDRIRKRMLEFAR